MPDEANQIEYASLWHDSDSLQAFLQRLLGLSQPDAGQGVRCYATRGKPSQQMKNKLGQAVSVCRDGLMHLRVADEVSHRQAVAALRRRWERNAEWAKVAAVAVAYPAEDGTPRLASVVVHSRRPFLDRLIEAFPSVEVHFTVGASQQPERTLAAPQVNLPENHNGGVWLELFAGGSHGGDGWEHGAVLWSPLRAKGGGDRYSCMRHVASGDLILHAVRGEIVGFSYAAGPASQTQQEPPDAGKWTGMAPYYRLELRDYQRLSLAVPLTKLAGDYPSEIYADIQDPDVKYYPFCKSGGTIRTNQGMYLTRVTPLLYGLILRVGQPAAISADEMSEALFMEPQTFERILGLLKARKNVVLQGPPGVGKTLVGESLAWALIGARDPNRVGFVQFHQSYAYEDFVQGYRPTRTGGFARRDGVFLRFCDRARLDGRPHVFVVDEINRGNLSKIFGEVLSLLESDKRDRPISLTYHERDDPPFAIPHNVFLLGMMNTADRSLAVVDYALRRRFAFVTLRPEIESPRFRQALLDLDVSTEVVNAIIDRVGELNRSIRTDVRHLGPGFEIGHSFFCGYDGSQDSWAWYRQVIENEVGPLLEEYWYDDPAKAKELRDRLAE